MIIVLKMVKLRISTNIRTRPEKTIQANSALAERGLDETFNGYP